MYIRRIHLQNICGIGDLNLCLTDGDRATTATLFIGENGTGKSSVLRAIVLGLASETEAAALLAEPFGSPFISVGQETGIIDLELVDAEGKVHRSQKKIERAGKEDEKLSTTLSSTLGSHSLLVVAFGAGRSIEGSESSPRYSLTDSTYMLFSYEGTFINPELTLRRLRDYVGTKEYNSVLVRIRKALGLQASDALMFQKGGGVVVSGPYKERAIPLHSWADGYRVTLNWILDIYAWAMRHGGSIDSQGHVSGVLLIDEIEQHLHPSMQRGIVHSLKKLFPKLQIIASTHSPLVLQGVAWHEIFSLYRNGSSVTTKALRDYSGYSVEDLLTSEELFRIPPYSLQVEDIRTRYRSLMAKADLSAAEQDQLRCLGRKLANFQILSPQHKDETIDRFEARLSELANDSHCEE